MFWHDSVHVYRFSAAENSHPYLRWPVRTKNAKLVKKDLGILDYDVTTINRGHLP